MFFLFGIFWGFSWFLLEKDKCYWFNIDEVKGRFNYGLIC